MSTSTCLLYAECGVSAVSRIKGKAAATLGDKIRTDILVIKALGPKILNGGVAKWGTVNAILHNATIHWQEKSSWGLEAFLS